jgi:Holliday junction resolvase-like predicted endonuclease
MNTTTSIGQCAETAAAEYLKAFGYRILVRNWRTKLCEIDIVAQKDGEVYFVEVKYRRSGAQGSGLDYITPKKLTQMRFAAELWVQQHQYDGGVQLAAIEVSGQDFQVTGMVTDIY